MDEIIFAQVLAWRMCSDHWPEGVDRVIIDDWLDHEARERGYTDWIDAYHKV